MLEIAWNLEMCRIQFIQLIDVLVLRTELNGLTVFSSSVFFFFNPVYVLSCVGLNAFD